MLTTFRNLLSNFFVTKAGTLTPSQVDPPKNYPRTWPKPTQKPYPPILLGGAYPWAARRAVRYGDGWYPNASSGDPEEYLPGFKRMAQEAGGGPLPVTLGGAPEDVAKLARFKCSPTARKARN